MGLTGGLASNGTSGGGGGGGGTVTSVTAGSSKITVATGTTTPVIDLGAGAALVRKFPFAYNTAGVSKDPTGAATVTAGSAPSTPLAVVTGVNDTFVFTPKRTGTPETFTVAAGTYSTVAACVAAMAAAVGGSAEAFSTKATPSNSGGKILLTEPTGTNGNHDTITVGATDVSAGLGFASPSTFAGVTIGAALYTPTIGDVLLDAWLSITTAWDGTTPIFDLGNFAGGHFGLFVDTQAGIDMTSADNDFSGLLLKSNVSLREVSALSDVGTFINVNGAGPSLTWAPATGTSFSGGGPVPLRFTTADPIKVCVSQDGTNTAADPGSTQGAAILYLSTVTPL